MEVSLCDLETRWGKRENGGGSMKVCGIMSERVGSALVVGWGTALEHYSFKDTKS
jgi:hypothetical protein